MIVSQSQCYSLLSTRLSGCVLPRCCWPLWVTSLLCVATAGITLCYQFSPLYPWQRLQVGKKRPLRRSLLLGLTAFCSCDWNALCSWIVVSSGHFPALGCWPEGEEMSNKCLALDSFISSRKNYQRVFWGKVVTKTNIHGDIYSVRSCLTELNPCPNSLRRVWCLNCLTVR